MAEPERLYKPTRRAFLMAEWLVTSPLKQKPVTWILVFSGWQSIVKDNRGVRSTVKSDRDAVLNYLNGRFLDNCREQGWVLKKSSDQPFCTSRHPVSS